MKRTNYISIRQYLESNSIYPVKDRGYYGMYHSPLREDPNPSFKVDYQKDLWCDFGTNEGGSIIDLVMRLEQCSLSDAFQRLEGNSFSSHRDNTPNHSLVSSAHQESALSIQKIMPLTHPVLVDFLRSKRSIDIETAKYYCSEIHYSISERNYFAVGFKNDIGGWELRSPYCKLSVSPKSITTINNFHNTAMVFEGFIDFLSYLMLKQNPTPTIDSVILNSISNLSKAIPFLQSHKTVHAFLDNDEGGRRSLVGLCESLTSSDVVNHSDFYRDYKDLNEYWQARSHSQKQAKKRGRCI